MSLTREDVRKVAQLARLALRPDEEERYTQQLGQILHYVERLQELDVTGVEPMAHAVPQPALERPDEVRPSLPREVAMGNAPQPLGEGLAVPKIIE